MRHVPVLIGSFERVLSTETRKVDVIANQHDVSNLKFGVKTSSCVGDHQGVHTQKPENPHRECHLRNTR